MTKMEEWVVYMRKLNYMTQRNLTLFWKNKRNVVLSLFAIIIVYGLYMLFLRDFIISTVQSFDICEHLVDEFTDLFMISGLLIVINTVTCFGILQICVHDVEGGSYKGFLIAPIERIQLYVSYWISSMVISSVYTCIAWLGSMIYFYFLYSRTLVPLHGISICFVILVSSTINSLMMLCFVRWIKDTTTFSTFGNLYGMMVGFLAGVYLPYELYPFKLKQILFYFPPTHLVSIIRQIFLKGLEVDLISVSYGDIKSELFQVYGIQLLKDGSIYPLQNQWLLLTVYFFGFLICFQFLYREHT